MSFESFLFCLLIVVLSLSQACDISAKDNLASSSVFYYRDGHKKLVHAADNVNICSPFIDTPIQLDLKQVHKLLKLCVVVKVTEKSELTVIKKFVLSSEINFKINNTNSTQLQHDFNGEIVKSLEFKMKHGSLQICYVGLKGVPLSPDLSQALNELEVAVRRFAIKDPRPLVTKKQFAIISKTFYGNVKTNGFRGPDGCDWNIFNENKSYNVELLKVYLAEGFYVRVHFNLIKAGAPGFVQIRGGKNLTSKKRWKSYGSLAVDKTGVYNLNASFEANVIKFITFEWGKDGIVDALCDFQIEVLESMEVVELDIVNMTYLVMLLAFPLILIAIALLFILLSRQNKKKKKSGKTINLFIKPFSNRLHKSPRAGSHKTHNQTASQTVTRSSKDRKQREAKNSE